MTNWYNYLLPSKHTRLTEGHIKSEELYEKILNQTQDTAYCCYFDLEYASLKNEFFTGKFDSDGKRICVYLKQGEKGLPEYYAPELTFRQYEGIAKPALNMVSFDFDGENPEDALQDVRKFCEWLAVTDIAIFYSGSKGFHIMIPFSYFPFEVNEHLPNQLKDIAKYLKEIYPTLDASIYDYSRKFRLPFSRHEKTSRVKSFVPVEYINEWTMDTICQYSESQKPFDFLSDLEIDKPRVALDILITLSEQVKRKSYEVEKEKGGSLAKPSPFESYDGKLCIQKLLTSRCEDVGRNNACLRIVNDFFRTGKTLSYAQDNIFKWSDANGLPRSEATQIINNIYERGANYNFGCQDDIKSLYCSAKCSIWKKLDPDKRPVTVDQPNSAAAEKIKEFELVQKILMKTFKCEFDDVKCEYYGGLICKQGKEDLFYYENGKWVHLQASDIDKIKRRLNAIAKAALSIKQIDAMFKMLFVYVPSVPNEVDMFSPRPNCANFKNGTLHLIEDIEGKFELIFKSHSYKDYLTSMIDYDYSPNPTKINNDFISLLERMFSEDEDKADKILGIQEMFGASLMPYFPHLFYLYGVANSGKSSIVMILNYLLGQKNISSVQPKHFNGFNMESMIGKLVNMVTDVDTRRPMDDDVVKMIEDRIPVTIRRKNKPDIQAPLPALHVFCGNDLMTSYEGYSAAMKRRWSLFKFNKAYDGPKSRNFAAQVFRNDPQGVLNFAILGLQRLVGSQGYFTEFKSSNEELKAWGEESDVVAQFLDAALHNETEIPIQFGEELRIERKLLWEMFFKWQEDSGLRYDMTLKQTLYKRIAAKGYKLVKIKGAYYFKGLGESNNLNATQNINTDTIDSI